MKPAERILALPPGVHLLKSTGYPPGCAEGASAARWFEAVGEGANRSARGGRGPTQAKKALRQAGKQKTEKNRRQHTANESR